MRGGCAIGVGEVWEEEYCGVEARAEEEGEEEVSEREAEETEIVAEEERVVGERWEEVEGEREGVETL